MRGLKPMVLIALLGTAALLGGCATSREVKQPLVCPECKLVTVTYSVPVFEADGNVPPRQEEVTEDHHSCPGCQSALASFFKEGRWRHQCALCGQARFSCPRAHR